MSNNVVPNYKKPGFINIPSTFLKLFGANPLRETFPESFYKNTLGSEKILFFLFDGFGHNLYQKVGLNYPFFMKLAEKGIYNSIQTVFPSTTAAAISTINSGLSPIEHGLHEWFVYFQELDAIFESLPFKPVLKGDSDKTISPPPKILFNQKTVYEYLNNIQIPSFIFINKQLVGSFYNTQISQRATVIPYNTYPHLMVELRRLLNESKSKVYIYVYIPSIDSAEHAYGPWTKEVEAEISSLSNLFETEFIPKIDPTIASKTALFMTADHGQVPTDPNKTFYLDAIPGFKDLFEVSSNGKPILPTGNCRDVFLHLKPEKLDLAIKLLESRLPFKTEILKINDCIEKGWFGNGNMHPEFLNRVGNILLLPNNFETIWYHYTPEMSYKLKGNHGGQSEDEILVPFISAKLSDIQSNSKDY